ncbi:mitochondrial import inner membrane translocase subunit TIM9, putative [Plasmodium chabaudi chabaudi]|uniref:Mitochondrial import inner membrane translocase subunit n=2 Tax=Plasmodium chabaudi TaxID=5825 RepID=A0A077TQT4_PLACU|nr:mitochondrial import inner membrane translocase subunit TIM9, putative [Plasmodium chabaudi chabaudi]SCM22905.1 mitochondrial import inner membrane translocase subunit TIM9, putative [Plasmodium chabaudi adami]SCM24146.1 mitochondrial import inner membrane translocase subunit TIM9, putative [Plasmodium chabaudi chabaudi]SCN61629.1 mitochondrial import inner membrane translocase subunit TIM9, putative [Plasmodium chabaudi chabaudi]VTZ69433.1 mitochondrial import inner membrane translocase sub|eukprot:XP_738679.2 mitochondrial import inner membrane translocase subunit TIM9, putative [Plasmodium chabaudi chabaudi]
MDKSLDLSGFNKNDREKVLRKINKAEYEDTMNTYNSIVEMCFNECISSFRSKELDSNENSCILNCVKKFSVFSQRVGLKFTQNVNNEMQKKA